MTSAVDPDRRYKPHHQQYQDDQEHHRKGKAGSDLVVRGNRGPKESERSDAHSHQRPAEQTRQDCGRDRSTR